MPDRENQQTEETRNGGRNPKHTPEESCELLQGGEDLRGRKKCSANSPKAVLKTPKCLKYAALKPNEGGKRKKRGNSA